MKKTQFSHKFFSKCVFVLVIMLIFGLFFSIQKTFANNKEASTAEELQQYLSSGGEIKLINDITLDTNTFVTSDATLDLNGYTLNLSNKKLSPYEASLTIKDYSDTQSGTITGTGTFPIIVGDETHSGGLVLDAGTINCEGDYGIRNYGDLLINGGTISSKEFTIYHQGSSFVMNGGSIISTNGTAVYFGQENTSFTMNGGLVKTLADDIAIVLPNPNINSSFIMNGGRIEALYGTEEENTGGVAIAAFKDTEVTINGGTIISFSFAIISNGSYIGSNNEGTNAKFNINGGTITSMTDTAIYAPQIGGVTTVTGGEITGRTGIEIRSGTLNISGGTIIGNGEYNQVPNTNGTTTSGAAIAIAQHTTAQAIIVNITGGYFSAEVPISNANPLNHDQATFNEVNIKVKGGKFTGENLDEVINNIPEGYTILEDGSVIIVIQTNPEGYYLNANSSGSIDISGKKGTVAKDYSDIDVLSNCYAGYDLVMSTTVNNNSLYLDSDDSSNYSFSPIEDDAPLNSVSDTWGYFVSNNTSYIPTDSDHFHPVPTISNPIAIKTTSSTASDSNINDKTRLYFGANIGRDLIKGTYQLIHDESNEPGSIVYQITASPTCTDMPIEISFNQNIDGEGGSETDPTIDNFPTYMDNRIHVEGGEATITLSSMIPTRDDFAFVEWNTRPDGTGTPYHPNDAIVIGDDTEAGELTGYVTLYAIWANGCAGGAICYDGNGADDGSMDNQTGVRGSSVALISPNFSRAGYGFAGWNTKPDGTGINYGPNQNILIPTSGGVILYANWVESVGTLQTWTGASSMEIGDITALTDERDGQTYAVAKLADGKVWFIENSRLDPSAANFTLLNTNHPTNSFIINAPSSSSSNNLCKNNNSACVDTLSYNTNNINRSLIQSPTNNDIFSAWYSYGVYYNWYTATAGNGTYDFSNTSGEQGDGTVSGDICPAGWHLPTGNNGETTTLNDAIIGFSSNDTKLRSSPNNFIRSGEFSGILPNERGGFGRFWTSTAIDKSRAYRLGYGGGTLTPNNAWNKWSGFTVRCVYDGNRIPASKVTVNLPEHVSSVSFSNATYGEQTITTSGSIITLANNTTYNISAEFEGAYTLSTWTTTENGELGNATSIDTSYMVSGTTTLGLVAKESTLTSYTLNYNTGASADVIPSDNASSYNTSYTFNITNTRPYLFGQTFIGWSETEGATIADYMPEGTITLVNPNPDNISSITKTLYAVYKLNTCPAENICYFNNGADSGVMENQAASSYSNINLIPSNYSKVGYGFAGWITDENATPYGPNATIATPDLSTSGLKLYAKWIESTGELQSWTGCNAMSVGDVTALTDNRDNNVYMIAKLADNKCWITENLRLNPGTATITTLNTNNPTASFISASESAASSKTLCNSNNSNCFDKIQYNTNNADRSLTQSHNNNDNSSAWYSYGTYYNWFTATAGNGIYDTISSVNGDICPKNWHIPTGNTNGEYNTLNRSINGGSTTSDANWRAYPNNFIWSGDYNNNKRTGSYANARIWTSTAKVNNTAYRVGLDSGSVTAASNAYNKWDAFVVRCMYNN